MCQFIEKSHGGGVSYIAQRYSKGNNKYMKSYDNSKPSICIIYLDVNNFYSWTMIQCLSRGEFRRLTQDKSNNLDVNTILDNNPESYI